MVDEQHENLKDVLGFDPNASSDEPTGGGIVPRPKDERYGWPENWKDLLETAKSRRKDKAYVGGDDEKLLIITRDIRSGTIIRAFYRFDSTKSRFGMGSEAFFFSGGRRFINTRADNDSQVFLELEDDSLNPIKVGKKIGGRWLTAHYFGNGKLNGLEFETFSEADIEKGEIPEQTSTNIYFSPERGFDYDSRNGFDFDTEVLATDNKGILRRVEDGEIKDDIEVPLVIDPDNLKKIKDCIPDPLLRNPKDTDVRLDHGWKGIDFFQGAGLKWDPIADDRARSLTAIPPPAPEDQ